MSTDQHQSPGGEKRRRASQTVGRWRRHRLSEVSRSQAARAIALGLFAILAFGVLACSVGPGLDRTAPSELEVDPTLILISLDGFRWDYLEVHSAPTLSQLATQGVRSEGLIPTFPSKTFPNHYSVVTGLYPENHGIVGNNMWDPTWEASFSLRNRKAVEDGRWWEGEPIWVTAEKQGLRAATYFWPGSEAEIGGHRPSFWKRFDNSVPASRRVAEVLDWLALPESERPSLVTLYFSDVDSAGHRYGPTAPETAEAVERVDGYVAELLAGIERAGLRETTAIVVTSDHGMSQMDPERVLVLEDHIDVEDVRIVDLSCIAMLQPRPGSTARVLDQLREAHPALHVHAKGSVPERLHFSDHRRIPEVVAWMDPGWYIYPTHREREARRPNFSFGMHGFDPAERDMHGLLIAQGGPFRSGATVPTLENVHLYEMFARVLSLRPAPNDGDPAITEAFFEPSRR